MTNPYTHPDEVAMVPLSQPETFEEMALRLARKHLTWQIEPAECCGVSTFTNALRSELAKQAGSVEPVKEWTKVDGEPLYPATALAAQAAKIAELQDEIVKLKPDADRTCTWALNDNEFGTFWEGSCGAAWTFIEDGPKENEMHYCPQCGEKIAIDAARNAK